MQEYRSCTSALQRVLAQTNTVHLGPVALGSLALKYRFSSAYICSFPHMQFHWPSPKYLSHHTGSPFLGGHSYIYVNTYLKTAPAVLFHRSIQCYRPVKVSKYAFFFFIYFYQLEANHFTTLSWVLPYTDMNQPWIYMYSPS